MEDLLKAAIRDPFVDFDKTDLDDPPPIWKWYGHLVENFPLLTFQNWKYRDLNDEQRPSSYPLSLIVDSILRDEASLAGSPFLSHLNARRMELAKAPTYGVFTSCHPTERESWPRFEAAADVPEMADEEGWSYSLYEEIGRTLCTLIDAREEANAEGKVEAQSEIDEFLETLGRKRGRGGTRAGPPDDFLKSLHAECEALFELAWEVLAVEPSNQTRHWLSEYGIEGEAQAHSAAHLAIPVLSACESIGLRLHPRTPLKKGRRSRGGDGPSVTRRRFAVFLLAHRFGIAPPSLARRILGSGEEEEFKNLSPPQPFVLCRELTGQ